MGLAFLVVLAATVAGATLLKTRVVNLRPPWLSRARRDGAAVAGPKHRGQPARWGRWW